MIAQMLDTGNFAKVTKLALLACACLLLSSCSMFAENEAGLTPKKTQVYGVAFRQLPPEPVYNRVRLVYLPDVKPALAPPESNAAPLVPTAKLSLRNNTLEQAAIALAAVGNYQAYTASSIAKQKVSLEAVGSVDELARQLASKTGTHIVVDHPNRQIRILKQNYQPSAVTEPRFLDEAPGAHLQQQAVDEEVLGS